MGITPLGRFEHLLLLAVIRLGDDAYGMTIRQELAAHTGREVAVGAIYTALSRLETRGFVQSKLGDPTPQRGGRAKRFYRVLPAGTKAVATTEAALLGLTRAANRTSGRS
jgi:PadR family transcriptional regulator, regulatory protein PadR